MTAVKSTTVFSAEHEEVIEIFQFLHEEIEALTRDIKLESSKKKIGQDDSKLAELHRLSSSAKSIAELLSYSSTDSAIRLLANPSDGYLSDTDADQSETGEIPSDTEKEMTAGAQLLEDKYSDCCAIAWKTKELLDHLNSKLYQIGRDLLEGESTPGLLFPGLFADHEGEILTGKFVFSAKHKAVFEVIDGVLDDELKGKETSEHPRDPKLAALQSSIRTYLREFNIS